METEAILDASGIGVHVPAKRDVGVTIGDRTDYNPGG
jgi:hypothetical protein